MNSQRYNFEQAFTELTLSVQDQAKNSGIISFSEEISRPFQYTLVPSNSQPLQSLGKLFEQQKGLLLRFSGPAIYLIVSTTLQFPPSSIFTKTIYFFIDTLIIYKENAKAKEAIRPYIGRSDVEKEVKERQRYIFDPLMKRLRELLVDESKDAKVRRLTAQLIMSLCLDNPIAWKRLMKGKHRPSFGRLFRQSGDYVFRVLVADIVRHLRAQNFDMYELWDEVDEEAMDFPSSQKVGPTDLERLLDVMSGMDVKRAAVHSTSRIYRLKDINIPNRDFHVGGYQAILVLDDSISILTPDTNAGSTTLHLYEFSIDGNVIFEEITSRHGPATLCISWRHDKGYWFFRGKKSAVTQILLEFAESAAHTSFVEGLRNMRNRMASDTMADSVSQGPSLKCKPLEFALTAPQLGSENEDDENESNTEDDRKNLYLHTTQRAPTKMRQRPDRGTQGRIHTKVNMGGLEHIESDTFIGGVELSSGVFAPESNALEKTDGGNTMERPPTQEHFDGMELLSGQATDLADSSIPQTPKSTFEHGLLSDLPSSSSPLQHRKRKLDESFAAAETITGPSKKRIGNGVTLSRPLDQNSDSDYVSFKHVASHDKQTSTPKSHLQQKYGKPQPSRKELPSKSQDIFRNQIAIESPTNSGLVAQPSSVQNYRPKSKNVAKPVNNHRLNNTLKGFQAKTSAPVTSNLPAKRKKEAESVQKVENVSKSASEARAHSVSRIPGRDKNTGNSSRPVLKNLTNTAPDPGELQLADTESRASEITKSKGAVVHPKQPSTTVATRKSSRLTAKKAKIYMQSPSLGNDEDKDLGMQHDSNDSRQNPKQQLSFQQSQEARADDRRAPLHTAFSRAVKNTNKTGCTLSSPTPHQGQRRVKESQNNSIGRNDTESNPPASRESARNKQHRAKCESPKPDVNTKSDLGEQKTDNSMHVEDVEIVEDSYPNQLQHETATAHVTFNMRTMLDKFVPNVSRVLSKTDRDLEQAPFGDPAQFIHNVSAAKNTRDSQFGILQSNANARTGKTPRQNKSASCNPSHQQSALRAKTSKSIYARLTTSSGLPKQDVLPETSAKSVIIHFGAAGPSNQGPVKEAKAIAPKRVNRRVLPSEYRAGYSPVISNARIHSDTSELLQQSSSGLTDLPDSAQEASDFNCVIEACDNLPNFQDHDAHTKRGVLSQLAHHGKDIKHNGENTRESDPLVASKRAVGKVPGAAAKKANLVVSRYNESKPAQSDSSTESASRLNERSKLQLKKTDTFSSERGGHMVEGNHDSAMLHSTFPKAHEPQVLTNSPNDTAAPSRRCTGETQPSSYSPLRKHNTLARPLPSEISHRRRNKSGVSQETPISISSNDNLSEQNQEWQTSTGLDSGNNRESKRILCVEPSKKQRLESTVDSMYDEHVQVASKITSPRALSENQHFKLRETEAGFKHTTDVRGLSRTGLDVSRPQNAQPDPPKSIFKTVTARPAIATMDRLLSTKNMPVKSTNVLPATNLHDTMPKWSYQSNVEVTNKNERVKIKKKNDETTQIVEKQKHHPNIKRVRNLSALISRVAFDIAPTTSTPQPFHERLLACASTSPNVQISATGDGNEMLNERSGSRDTTLVETCAPFERNTIRSSPSTSTRRSDASPSPEPESRGTLSDAVHVGNFDPSQLANATLRDVQKTLTSITKRVFIRLEQEERMAKSLVQQYCVGCTELLGDLEKNATTRMTHDASKLKSTISQEQDALTDARRQFLEPLATNEQPVEVLSPIKNDEVHGCTKNLLAMLADVAV